jgi:hypothetical protein
MWRFVTDSSDVRVVVTVVVVVVVVVVIKNAILTHILQWTENCSFLISAALVLFFLLCNGRHYCTN